MGNCQWIPFYQHVCCNFLLNSAPHCFPFHLRRHKSRTMSLLGSQQDCQVRLRWLTSPLENPDCLSIASEDFFYNTARAVDYKTHFRARAQGAEVSETRWPALLINCVRGGSSLSVQCCRGLGHLFRGQCYAGTATRTLGVICGGGQLWTALNFSSTCGDSVGEVWVSGSCKNTNVFLDSNVSQCTVNTCLILTDLLWITY